MGACIPPEQQAAAHNRSAAVAVAALVCVFLQQRSGLTIQVLATGLLVVLGGIEVPT